MKRTYYNPYHVAFLIILTIHYFLSFIFLDGIIFAQETDVFEAELLFNKILGDIYKKDFYILDSLLSGNYEWYYFTRALYIINYIYSFFSTENAYLIIDIACKTVAYISFFKLSKLVNNKNFYSFLISAIYAYASTSSFTDYHSSIFGFGSAILPYLTYLSLKKKDLKIKNFLIIILSAINSHFYFGIFYLLIPFILYLYDNNLNKIKSLKIFIIFFIFCIIANSNLLYLALFNEVTFNRDNWQTESLSIYQNIAYFFNSLFYFPLHFTSIELPNGEIKNILAFTTFFNNICLFLIYSLALFLLVTNKIKNSLLFLIIILGILLISFISKTHLYSSLIDYFDIGIVKTIQMTRIKVILTFIILFAISNIRINKIKNYIFMTLIFTFFIFQINYILLPAFKKHINYNSYTDLEKKELKYNIINFNFFQLIVSIKENFIVSIKENFKEEENHNYLTINNYYDTQNFTYIKNLVKDEYVLPININPAKLIYNRIKTAGGYFQFYPQSYKDKFEKIIDNELNKNITWKKDFDTWGHRLYAFVEDSRNIELNFMQIKKMKITYLLSNIKLLDENLETVCENCNDNKKINLYSIK